MKLKGYRLPEDLIEAIKQAASKEGKTETDFVRETLQGRVTDMTSHSVNLSSKEPPALSESSLKALIWGPWEEVKARLDSQDALMKRYLDAIFEHSADGSPDPRNG